MTTAATANVARKPLDQAHCAAATTSASSTGTATINTTTAHRQTINPRIGT